MDGCCARTARRCRGVYAVGEAAGFGGGGMHGYRALEGTFLGGCLFTGRLRAGHWQPACDRAFRLPRSQARSV